MYTPNLEEGAEVKVFNYEEGKWTDWRVSFVVSCTSLPFEVRLVCLEGGEEKLIVLYSDTAVLLFTGSCDSVIPRVSRFRGQFEYLLPGQESVSKADIRYFQHGNVGYLRVSIRGINSKDVVHTTFSENGACWCGGEVHPRSVVPLDEWQPHPVPTRKFRKGGL